MSQNRNISHDGNLPGTGYPSSSSPPPPSYTQATTSGSQLEPVSSGRLASHPTHDSVEQLLRRLPLQVRNARQDQLSQQNGDEHRVVERLAQHIAEFIRNIPTSVFYTQKHQPPLLAELILVPADAVPPTQGWVLSDLGQRKENAAHVRVVEVDSHDKEKDEYTDRKGPNSADETFWGGGEDLMWWRKEDLADRLASKIRDYLQPNEKDNPPTRSDIHFGNPDSTSDVHPPPDAPVLQPRVDSKQAEVRQVAGPRVPQDLAAGEGVGRRVRVRGDEDGAVGVAQLGEEAGRVDAVAGDEVCFCGPALPAGFAAVGGADEGV
ncbi:hypothetical protein VM1G_09448 [Cytospora mali]|uniref:Uncharacterized protein n=1 Tax=Cytospora mali TaxID=578113 RepID=A0A194WC46_CYTMA|nr:hypothetical protein VM1G_09448 [Valsa mali]